SSKLNNLKEQLTQLESSVNSINMTDLEDMKDNIELDKKYRSENIARIEETKKIVSELDTSSKTLKKKIEENVVELTNTKYSIIQLEN
ncbi:MAG TPA: hypothetical protein VL854_03960, partial [Nitrososphaeraceae archaeon]|nr:hypothetical protein [Nitrososphaeraceae archaeon]